MSRSQRLLPAVLIAFACAGCATLPGSASPPTGSPVVWRFDNLDRVGGLAVRTEGGPKLVETQFGRAIAFDGVDDAVFLARHPLAGASTFTFEAIFRPDGGAFEQRWFHLAEGTPTPPEGADPPVQPGGPRLMFEIRVVNDGWYLDAFASGPGYSKALMVPEKRHPLGQWHHVAQVYDGRFYRSYVNGVLQQEAEIAFQPQGEGHASVGTRINRRDYFHGAVLTARFTPRALAPSEFMPQPGATGRR